MSNVQQVLRRELPLCLFLFLATGAASAAVPRIFFSDLESGPNSGGEENNGLYVTICGIGFGFVRGESVVTVGGGAAAAYPVWTDTKVSFQLGPAAASGDIVVRTPAAVSNGVPFTVRPGNIYFVSPAGNDSASGLSGSPWRKVQHAVEAIRAGDTVYVMDGVTEASAGSSYGSVNIRSSGAPGSPKALVGYPNARAVIGDTGRTPCYSSNCVEGLTTYNNNEPFTDWVIAGLQLRGNNGALTITGAYPEPSSRWKVVGNDLSCPYGDGANACFSASQVSDLKFYGNNTHDSGHRAASSLYQGVYFSTDSNRIDMGWNTVVNISGCRGVQVHSSPLGSGGAGDPTGFNQYSISIHDNLIHDTQCDGIVLGTVDPSKGKVEVFNNIIYRTGKGPSPADGGGNFSCIYAAGETNQGAAGGGTVEVYNNTMYDCGARKLDGASGAIENGGNNPALVIRLRNNIIIQPPGQAYVTSWNAIDYSLSDGRNAIVGSNNLWFGNGAPPAGFTNSINSDPLFVNLAARDFHLQAGSPARNMGVNTGISTDKEGAPRPETAPYELGALQVAVLRIAQLSCGAATLVTPASLACSVTLSDVAPTGGVVVSLTSSNPGLAIPFSFTIPAGAGTASFGVAVAAVSGPGMTVTISAGFGDSARTVTITLLPPVPPVLRSLNCFPATLVTPGKLTCTAILTAPVPAGSVSISLFSSDPTVIPSSSVTVPSGVVSAQAVVPVPVISVPTTVTVTARLDSHALTAAITLLPPPPRVSSVINAGSPLVGLCPGAIFSIFW